MPHPSVRDRQSSDAICDLEQQIARTLNDTLVEELSHLAVRSLKAECSQADESDQQSLLHFRTLQDNG